MYVKPAKGSKTSCKNILKSMKVSTPGDANFLKRHYCRVIFLTTTLIVFLFAFIGPVNGAGHIDPEADKILHSMSDYLKGLPRFSVNIDIDTEVIDLAGQKLQISSSGKIILERPGNLYVARHGAFADVELIFDGKSLTLHGKNLNIYFQKDKPGTIDTAFDTLQGEIGLDAPGADLFYTDSFEELTDSVASSAYLGTVYVNDVECHYLTFREAKVDWQLWVRAEGDPLPMKYVITTKWMTGAPQYAIRFRDWNINPQIAAGVFDFKVPEGAKKLEVVKTNMMGDLVTEEGK
jgi:hypothetical protein